MDLDFADEVLYRAKQLTGGDNIITHQLLLKAHIEVLRRVVSQTLPGGEEEFWKMVYEELR